jgi:hypothetical protein
MGDPAEGEKAEASQDDAGQNQVGAPLWCENAAFRQKF